MMTREEKEELLLEVERLNKRGFFKDEAAYLKAKENVESVPVVDASGGGHGA